MSVRRVWRGIPRSVFLAVSLLGAGVATRAQGQGIDPAVVGERLQRLTAAVEALEQSLASQQRRIDGLGRDLHQVREELLNQGHQRPWADDLKRLADAIQEVDRKRAADADQVVKVLTDLRKTVASAAETPRATRTPSGSGTRGSPTKSSTPKGGDAGGDPTPDKAVPYVMQAGESLSRVVEEFNKQAKQEGYRPLTVQQVMRFNNITDARRIREGTTLQLPVIPK